MKTVTIEKAQGEPVVTLSNDTIETPEVFADEFDEQPASVEEILAIFSAPEESEPLDPEKYGLDESDLPEEVVLDGEGEETMQEYLERVTGEEMPEHSMTIEAPVTIDATDKPVLEDEQDDRLTIDEIIALELEAPVRVLVSNATSRYNEGLVSDQEYAKLIAFHTGILPRELDLTSVEFVQEIVENKDEDRDLLMEGVTDVYQAEIDADAENHEAIDEAEIEAENEVKIVAETDEYIDIEFTPRWEDSQDNPIVDEELNDLGQSPAAAEQMEAIAEDHDRAMLLAEIHDFYNLLDMPTMGRNFELMDARQLDDYLKLLRMNNGGSINMARLLQSVEVEYDTLMKSETLQMRMKLVEQQGVEVISTMQKMRQIVGNDFVINKVRAADYHNMLKSAVSFISVIHESISAIGAKLGMRMPVNELNKRMDVIPIIEGMPADPRVAMFVLRVLMAYIDKFDTQLDFSNKQLLRNEERIKFLENREKNLMKNMEDAQSHAQALTVEYERFRANNSHWMIKDQNGNILRRVYPEEPIRTTKDLDLRGTESDHLEFNSKTAARTWAQRLMGTRRFRNRELKVYRVSIIEDSN